MSAHTNSVIKVSFLFLSVGTQTNSIELVLDLSTSLPENCMYAATLITLKRKNREAICKVRLIEIQELVPAGSKILCICETMLYKQSDNV